MALIQPCSCGIYMPERGQEKFLCFLKKILCPSVSGPEWSFNNVTMDDLTSCKIYCNPSSQARPLAERHVASLWLRQPRQDSNVNLRVQPKGVIPPQGVSLMPLFAHFCLRHLPVVRHTYVLQQSMSAPRWEITVKLDEHVVLKNTSAWSEIRLWQEIAPLSLQEPRETLTAWGKKSMH